MKEVLNLRNAIKYVKWSYNEVVDGRKLYELATDERKAVKIDGWDEFWLVGDENEAHYRVSHDGGKNYFYLKPCYLVFSVHGKLNASSARKIVNFWFKKIWRKL